ncbi:YitT family protein [Clostridium polynesiense]|uniref:YitT family protein n=1 Tax=Clostridium polynesiense TaxID=1325933 RepID=UPI00058EF9CE|nr:YitT family protein [Clostridium polynesiense]
MKGAFKEYLFITIGSILIAIAVEYFFIPNNLATGGITGLSLVINHYLPMLSTANIMIILNIILFLTGVIALGKAFGAKTLYGGFGLSAFMWFIENFLEPFAVTSDLMLASLFGSALLGAGLAVIFMQNASSGGTDIIAKILNKYFNINMGMSVQAVDLIVVVAGAVAFGLNRGLYSMLSVILNGVVINKVISGFNSCKEVMIMSGKIDKIKKYITVDMDRGCTILKGEGGYTGAETQVIYCVLGARELIRLKRYIREIDEKAFVTVNEAHEVMGEGFNNII